MSKVRVIVKKKRNKKMDSVPFVKDWCTDSQKVRVLVNSLYAVTVEKTFEKLRHFREFKAHKCPYLVSLNPEP